MTLTNHKVGDRVRVVDTYGPLSLNRWAKPGHEFTVTAAHSTSTDNASSGQLIDAVDALDRTISGYGGNWFEPVEESSYGSDEPDAQALADADDAQRILDSEAPARPLIDFSGSSRATAREYAAALNSRVLKPGTRALLSVIAEADEGLAHEVDAYALVGAIPDIMTGVATRFGQSQQRRDAARMARYLAHIAQAVIENHADGLPAYADGERSRKIETLEGQIEDSKFAIKAADEEIQRQTAEVEHLKLHVAEQANQIADYRARVNRQAETIEGLQREEAVAHAALVYARSLLDDAGTERVEGFIDALDQFEFLLDDVE